MSISYFLGSSAGNGFFSIFDVLTPKIEGQYTYIIKGGPGTGKSSLMKFIANEMENHDIACERIFCSSDPESLDGVMIPSLRVSIADGTAPHTLDPDYPGANSEIVDLGGSWDKKMLKENAKKIIALTDKNKSCHLRCRKFISSAYEMYSDGEKIYREALDIEAVKKYAARLASRNFRKISSSVGIEENRLLEAVTPDGCVFLKETAEELCDEKIIFSDDFGVAAEILMNELRLSALASGFSIITSPKQSGGIKHFIIKELSIGFFTSDCLCPVELTGAKNVSLKRFYDKKIVSEHKARLAFSKKASKELINEAIVALKSAKTVHDELESIYSEAMNFEKNNAIARSLVKRILAGEWYPDEKDI